MVDQVRFTVKELHQKVALSRGRKCSSFLLPIKPIMVHFPSAFLFLVLLSAKPILIKLVSISSLDTKELDTHHNIRSISNYPYTGIKCSHQCLIFYTTLCIIPTHHPFFSKPSSLSVLDAVIHQTSTDGPKSVLGTGVSAISAFKKFIIQ